MNRGDNIHKTSPHGGKKTHLSSPLTHACPPLTSPVNVSSGRLILHSRDKNTPGTYRLGGEGGRRSPVGDGFYLHLRRPEKTLRKMDPTNVLGKPKEKSKLGEEGGRGAGAPGWNEIENENDSGKRGDKAK